MTAIASPTTVLLGLTLVSLLACPQQVLAGDQALERAQLAAAIRQLDMLERLAEHAANTQPEERSRYHFDYTRLRQDVQRVRAGINDYLTPRRAQPRDPAEIVGDYLLERPEPEDTP